MNNDDIKKEKERTLKQNKCMYQYFEEASQACSQAGITAPMLIEALKANGLEITSKFIKILWDFVIKTKYGYESTTQLSTVEMMDTYDEMNRLLSSFGLHVEWPSWDSVINRK